MKPAPKKILSLKIREKALQLGFEACGIAEACYLEEHYENFSSWLNKGYNASMGYMENHFDKRLDPGLIVEDAKSVIVLAHNYFPPEAQNPQAHYQVSKYAYSQDYHHVLKTRLFTLLDFIKDQAAQEIKARVFVDSAPVLERAWAVKAGIGNTGKNSCLIIPRKGSFFFLSEVIINLELDYDESFQKDLCGKCTRCIKACPTGAITGPGVIDASKCLSFLTIESKEEIPERFSGQGHNWIFGCDICQDVCPHNSFARPHQDSDFKALDYVFWKKEQWEELTEEVYNRDIKKAGSPLLRAGFKKLTGNINFFRNLEST